MLSFSEAGHEYKWNGVIVPSVTQIISTFLPVFDSELVRRAGEFGNVLHKTLELLDKNDLDSYDPTLEPYIEAWLKFKEDIIKPAKHNLLVDIKSGAYSKRWDYQTAAYIRLLDGLQWDDDEVYNEMKAYHTTFGYAGTVDRFYPKKKGGKIERVCAILQDNGFYKMPVFKNPVAQDFNKFTSMLNTYRIRQEFKIKGDM
jgi:hypothetical protein